MEKSEAEALDRAAAAEKRSKSSLIRLLVVEGLARRGYLPPDQPATKRKARPEPGQD